MKTEIYSSTSQSPFATGQGTATGTPTMLTGENIADLKRGVLVRNLSSKPLFVGDENVTPETGLVLHGDHLFPVDESGRLFVVGEPDLHTEEYTLTTFTWWAL